MRKLLIPFLLLSGFLRAVTPTIVQSKAAVATGAGPVTITLNSAPTPGNMLLIYLGYGGGSPYVVTPGISGWNKVAPCPVQANERLETYQRFIRAGDSSSYTFTSSNSYDYLNAVALEISNADAINQAACSGVGSSGATPSPAVTPTLNGTLAIATISPDSSGGLTNYTGWGVGTNALAQYHPIYMAVRTALTSDTTTPISNTFTGSNGGASVQNTILISPTGTPPALAFPAPAQGVTATPYNQTLAVTGGTPPYSCSGASGLPTGLSISSACVITGTPTTVGTYNATITASDASPNPAGAGTQTVTIPVVQEQPLTYVNTLSGVQTGYINTGFQVMGGNPPYTCTVSGGTVPAGLMKVGCGVVGVATTAGTTNFTLGITDSSNPALSTSGLVTSTIGATPAPQPLSAGSVMTVGVNSNLNGFIIGPNDAWHTPIDKAEIDPVLNPLVTASLGATHLHPDFGPQQDSNGNQGELSGLPYVIVDNTTAAIPITWRFSQNFYAEDPGDFEADPTLYPIPSWQASENQQPFCKTANTGSDGHGITINKDTLVLYETYFIYPCTDNTIISDAASNGDKYGGVPLDSAGSGWTAGNGAIFDASLANPQIRPQEATSADVGGLSVFEGLVTYEDITRGYVNHAIRFTTSFTASGFAGQPNPYVYPASHASGHSGNNLVTGLRIRLKANFDVSGFSKTNQIILNGMKKYGMILADNGTTGYFEGSSDTRWNGNDLQALKTIDFTSFETVAAGVVYGDHAFPPLVNQPVITSFSVSPTSVSYGTPVTFTSSVTNGAYCFIDNAGFTRGSLTFYPKATQTYLMTCSNQYNVIGQSDRTRARSSPVTVTVSGAPPTISSVSISGPNTISALGLYGTYKATATMSDSTTQDVSNLCTWSTSNAATAYTMYAGVAVGLLPGSVNVNASCPNSTSASKPITILAHVLTALALLPSSQTASASGPPAFFDDMGTYNDAGQQIDYAASFASSNASIATVNYLGIAQPLANGNTTITATDGSVSGTASLTVGVPPPPPSSLTVTYGSTGIQKIVFNGFTLHDVGAFPADAYHMQHAMSTNVSDGSVRSDGSYGWGDTYNSRNWDPVAHTVHTVYPWGTIDVHFAVNGNNIDQTVTTTNNSSSGIVYDGVEIYPFTLHFAAEPTDISAKSFNGYSVYTFAEEQAGVSVADDGVVRATQVVPDSSKWLYGGWHNGAVAHAYSPIMSGTWPDGLATFYPHKNRAVQPGQTDTYTVSTRFSASGVAPSAADAYASFAATYPPAFTWPSHAPMGAAYFASSSTGNINYPAFTLATDPRNYYAFQNNIDVTTPGGLATFQQRVLGQAQSNVTNAQATTPHMQAIITWDSEGQEYPQSTSYVCSPDKINVIAPEMNSNVGTLTGPLAGYSNMPLIDAYFKIQSDNGVQVGGCIRPQHWITYNGNQAANIDLTYQGAFSPTTPYVQGDVVTSAGSSYVSQTGNSSSGNTGHTPAGDATDWDLVATRPVVSTDDAIVAELDRKFAYAKARWNWNVVYSDSTVYINGGAFDPVIWQRVHADNPTFFITSEEWYPRDFAYVAPFLSFIFRPCSDAQSYPSDIYQSYPSAFSFILVNDVGNGPANPCNVGNNTTPLLTTYRPQLVAGVAKGDILTGHGDYQINYAPISAIYASAGSAPPPATLSSMTLAPATATVAIGATQALTCTATYSDGTHPACPSLTWTSAAAGIASVNASGVVTGVATGSAVITAASGTVSATSTITVPAPAPPPTLTAIALTPASVTVTSTQQLICTATYSDSTTGPCSTDVTYISNNTAAATVDNRTGLVSQVAPGSALVTATSQSTGLKSTSSITVPPPAPPTVVSISLTPLSTNVAVGGTLMLRAVATMSSGPNQDVTAQATWITTNAAVATVAGGVVTPRGPGTAAITARYQTVTSGAATVTVVSSIQNLRIVLGGTSVSGGATAH